MTSSTLREVIGYSMLVREIVRQHAKQLRGKRVLLVGDSANGLRALDNMGSR